MGSLQDPASKKAPNTPTIIEFGHEAENQSSVPSLDAKESNTYFQAIRDHPGAFMWCMYIVWVMLSSNYINTAGSSVLGIPRFRKDFGGPYEGDYVLPAAWQSAYFGAPSAA